MDSRKRKNIVLLTDTFPHGTGETFLQGELRFLAERFDNIVVYPLSYAPSKKIRETPANVIVNQPFLPFTQNDRIKLLLSSFSSLSTIFNKDAWFSLREFFCRAILGKEIKVVGSQKKAPVIKRVWLFFNYLFIYRSIVGNKEQFNKFVNSCALADIVYFYWSDKSAQIAPLLKKLLSKKCSIPPIICSRFHGSDFYEGAKGYLPRREEIYKSLDYGFPVSYHGANYISDNYHNKPSHLEVFHLGSKHHDSSFANLNRGCSLEKDNRTFRIVSCSNIIELKRVGLILDSIKLFMKDKECINSLLNENYTTLEWVHFGGGTLEKQLRCDAKNFLDSYRENAKAHGDNHLNLNIVIKGQTEHHKILEFYQKSCVDLSILLSRSEGCPISLQEAISFGIPIIATNVGAVSELFYDKNIGYLLDSNPTAEEVKKCILTYVQLPKEEKESKRISAYNCWKNHWDEEINYNNFASALSAIAER